MMAASGLEGLHQARAADEGLEGEEGLRELGLLGMVVRLGLLVDSDKEGIGNWMQLLNTTKDHQNYSSLCAG
jgi:hypothetical protein